MWGQPQHPPGPLSSHHCLHSANSSPDTIPATCVLSLQWPPIPAFILSTLPSDALAAGWGIAL